LKVKKREIQESKKLQQDNTNANNMQQQRQLHKYFNKENGKYKQNNFGNFDFRKKPNIENTHNTHNTNNLFKTATASPSKNNSNISLKSPGLFMTKLISSANTNVTDNVIKVFDGESKDINKNKKDLILPKIMESKLNKSKEKNGNSTSVNKTDTRIELIRCKFNNGKKPFFNQENDFSPDDTIKVRSKINKLVGKITKQFDDGKALRQFVQGYQENSKVYNHERLAYKKSSYYK